MVHVLSTPSLPPISRDRVNNSPREAFRGPNDGRMEIVPMTQAGGGSGQPPPPAERYRRR